MELIIGWFVNGGYTLTPSIKGGEWIISKWTNVWCVRVYPNLTHKSEWTVLSITIILYLIILVSLHALSILFSFVGLQMVPTKTVWSLFWTIRIQMNIPPSQVVTLLSLSIVVSRVMLVLRELDMFSPFYLTIMVWDIHIILLVVQTYMQILA